MEVVAILTNQRDNDRVKRTTAHQPAGVGLATIERPNESGGVLLEDSQDRRQFNMPPLPHRHRLAGPLWALEQPREDAAGSAGCHAVAAEYTPAQFVERRSDPRPRKSDGGTKLPHAFFGGADKPLAMSGSAALWQDGNAVEHSSLHGGSADQDVAGHDLDMPHDAARQAGYEPIC